MDKNDIYIIYGNNPNLMVKKILSKTNFNPNIDKNALIGIKPNLVVSKPSTSGATTSPEIVEGLIEYLQSLGYKNLIIVEGSWVGDSTKKAFKVCGYEEISTKYKVPLIDLQKDDFKSIKVKDLQIKVCKKALEVDYMINIPVLKGHCQTKMTCSLKNMKGCIPDSEKRRFHTIGLHKPIAYLNSIIKSDFIIVDGLMGDLSFEEGGNPVRMNRLIVGKDPVLLDAYIAELMGYDVEEVPYIKIADDIGVGSANINKANIIELNKDNTVISLTPSRRVEELSKYIMENKACSACYGTLIHALDRLDEKGLLPYLEDKIYIGQGFKNKQNRGIGIGICTKDFKNTIKGCPPKAKDIVDYIINKIESARNDK
ncbi:DUF362 domain-containing protein [Thermohalobacter berrensis]|uniref:Iron-sulfur cluster-binding protein n=1 Tax=Thermohalobacter berrensis TaxID=99594 RepID=A0A419T7D4_9FIRM|nr:DUF362 domain-containing protein [Thermohalobacter berrensis]RKD33470.1 iron-sulfur cluster-binding protein [Thermohalobacter berrensis]